MPLNRREFITASAAASCGVMTAAEPNHSTHPTRTEGVKGMLLGSLIGDALGGPIEFLSPDQVRTIMPGARRWAPDRVLDAKTRTELAASLRMRGYEQLRPKTAPYGPWQIRAKPGTITDDSRHKIVLMRALRKTLGDGRRRLNQRDLAEQFLQFRPRQDRQPSKELAALIEEGLREYRYACRWLLGKRDPELALPPERLWSGIPNCSGQMTLIPLAGLYPGDPQAAYRATYAIDFIDASAARDIAAAINAGLAAVLDRRLDQQPSRTRWQVMLRAIKQTDPYRLSAVPFAGRPLHKWLELSDSIVDRSKGRPAQAYRLLETEGKPVYYWDAHFTLLVPLTMLKLCDFDPLAAMHLTLDFGHDTDSYAQVLGAMLGAVHGPDLFPKAMQAHVAARLLDDYGESVDDWARTIAASSPPSSTAVTE